ncbi:uncharacterized protein LOC117124363 [Anneissia japonica]|uniref:uncharacterized protein LOC117124363 n=1 Tax=Anneissia japonica TaxID=1529436 RepID=UPI001425575F|nr:uncharacterized protein LOC117124363 [Anneissia japonica]XP_033126475.1 uncharacterized protein LOC117124363 [Anneissia japonica]XP_033126476.1 uncharacterized protein LOC117124363 [Anneissia japonica]
MNINGMDVKDKETLRRCRVNFCEDLTIEELVNPLIQVGLFTPNELQTIKRRSIGDATDHPMTFLLDGLEQKGPNAFCLFKDALGMVNKPHLLEILNKNDEGKGRIVKVADPDLNIEKVITKKKQDLKDFLNDSCHPLPDGSFKITKEDKDLLLQELVNLDQCNKAVATDCRARECICTEETVLCSRSSVLKAQNECLQKQLYEVKLECREKIKNAKKSILELLKPSEDQDDDNKPISVDLQAEISKLVLDIDLDESFA